MVAVASTFRLAARRTAQQCSAAAARGPSAPPARAAIARSFNTSARRFEDEKPRDGGMPTLSAEELKELESMDEDEAYEMMKKIAAMSARAQLPNEAEAEEEADHLVAEQYHKLVNRSTPMEYRRLPSLLRFEQPKIKAGFMAMGEEPTDMIEDAEFNEDEMPTMAHSQLQQHREYREYYRVAAWEMPLLTKMAKPFVPPTQKQILRFRYTSYMGEEHPAEKKVVVEFAVEDMPLSAPQKLKLKKLLGVRYNPGTGLAKMSSEMFPDQLQNKRYLGDLVDSLLKEARDPTDMFTDVPLDERHYKAKRKVKFPREWRMTPERMAQLEKTRAQAIALDEQKAAAGLLVDGKSIIESAQLLAKERAAKVLLESPAAAAGSAVKGKGAKKVSIRR